MSSNSPTNTELTTDEIEAELDKEVLIYKNYTDQNPMKGVSYDKSSDRHKVKHETLNTNIAKLTTACEKIKTYLGENIGNLIPDLILKNNFKYGGEKFILYWHNDKPLFDIQHILSTPKQSESSVNKKYGTHLTYENEKLPKDEIRKFFPTNISKAYFN